MVLGALDIFYLVDEGGKRRGTSNSSTRVVGGDVGLVAVVDSGRIAKRKSNTVVDELDQNESFAFHCPGSLCRDCRSFPSFASLPLPFATFPSLRGGTGCLRE